MFDSLTDLTDSSKKLIKLYKTFSYKNINTNFSKKFAGYNNDKDCS